MPNSKALLALERPELEERDEKLVWFRPDLKKCPKAVRWATIALAYVHGLNPLQKEVIPIENKGKWEPYVTLKGARRVAEVNGLNYSRVLSPLSDKWAQEFYGLTAEQTREMLDLEDADMVWVCGIFVEGKPYPFVELGIVGPTFPYRGRAAPYKMAAIRAERPALLAACNLPYNAAANGASYDVEPEDGEEPIEGEVTQLEEEPTEAPPAAEQPEEPDWMPEQWEEEVYYEEATEGGIIPGTRGEFIQRVLQDIPYYSHALHVENTMNQLGLEWSPVPEAEGELWKALQMHASERANEKAAAEEGEQQRLV